MKEKNCKNKNIVNLVIEREERMHLLSGLVVSSTRPTLLVRVGHQNEQHLVSFINTLSSEGGEPVQQLTRLSNILHAANHTSKGGTAERTTPSLALTRLSLVRGPYFQVRRRTVPVISFHYLR